MGKLDGKVAIISGGARGQGAAEAKLFTQEGAKVVFGDILDDEGKKVEAEIQELGGDALYVHLDVTSEDDWQNTVQTAVSKYGKVDILINNAGIIVPRLAHGMVRQHDRRARRPRLANDVAHTLIPTFPLRGKGQSPLP